MGCKVYSSEGVAKSLAGESAFDDPTFAVFDVAFREWGTLPSVDEQYIVVDSDEVARVVAITAAAAEIVSLP